MRRAAGPEVRGAAAGGPPGAPLPRGPPAPGCVLPGSVAGPGLHWGPGPGRGGGRPGPVNRRFA